LCEHAIVLVIPGATGEIALDSPSNVYAYSVEYAGIDI
jgi:hypothetical protein